MAVNTMRRVLSFQIIGHVGYMVMGLGLAAGADPVLTVFGMAAGILYLVHHMIVMTALLMAGGAAEIHAGSGSLLRRRLAGLAHLRPTLAVLFFMAAISLAGIPPFSGFVSKLALLEGALGGRHWTIAAVSLLVSLFTLMNMTRLWQTAFWGQPPIATEPPVARLRLGPALAPIGLLVALSLAIGLFSGPVFNWTSLAAQQVMDRTGYIQAVAPATGVE
jgi:multicomponent Na+:H+ antiporter subunit D